MNNFTTTQASSSKPRVAFLGGAKDRSTFGAKATEHFFKQDIDDERENRAWIFVPSEDHTAVLDALWEGKADFGVVAIENGVEGVINESARGVANLTARGIHVLEEVVLPVTFYFVSKGDVDLTKPVTIYAHPAANGQCKQLKRRLRQLAKSATGNEDTKVNIVSVGSNGAAATNAATSEGNCAAIANWDGLIASANAVLRLVDLKGSELSDDNPDRPKVLNRLLENPSEEEAAPYKVGDFENSTTRFWKLGHGQFVQPVEYEEAISKTGKKVRVHYNRTSILLNLDHDSPGGLMEALEHFSRRKCNLSLVYPIPIPGRQFEYSFMLEYEDGVENGKVSVSGHIDHHDGKLRAAYMELLNSGISLNPPIIFGAYRTEILGAYSGTYAK